ncbi:MULTISPECIES: exodeoxyribonuclease I [unclassified Janthinobacterium]|uniref:exodeoxyribonuclease I n=1 Tax=unclassified Janthinobacterium TaxID=2610881 RepID=UPI00160724C5|nr:MULTISPECIES: exodeoxyribonuclease I [unclassified Janthinobacterium]MBB5606825.1 exodeoxyribonuclease-1 [Janthinobacterium sp. S3T4]MBB5612125.1 exodeoxyribonuclease-1 [Janthinobacterium sp. S3M3]
MTIQTFLWHDYETFGVQPRRDRPAQFAAIRTDAELNEIGEPIMLYCQPANDFLPDPQSCLITGITPQQCLQQGVPEHAFATVIEAAFSEPGTIGVGYNTIRFDDEVTRFLLWRNLHDPYAREWKNHCGRWDLLDVVRMTHALRPDGMQWPKRDDGQTSFRLEHLSKANGLLHEAAHDALSDVRATIALARLIKQTQPKLFEFCLALHKKDKVASEMGMHLDAAQRQPFLHVSGMFPAESGCLGLVWPLATHPSNKNEVLVWDCQYDPRELATLDADTIRTRLFTRADAMPEGLTRLPVKSVHLNKSPMLVGNLKTLSPAMAERWGIDVETALANASHAASLPDMSATWAAVFQRPGSDGAVDVDEDLYGGFVSNDDRRLLDSLRRKTPAELAAARPSFADERLQELLFRYRARNFPQTLSEAESLRWEQHRAARLFDGEAGARTIEMLFTEIDTLSESVDERGEEILGELYDYVEMVAPLRD